MAVEDFFRAVLPKYASPERKGMVEILEHESDAKVKKVVWTNADFHHNAHEM